MTLLIRHWEIIYSLLFMGMFYIGGAMIYLFHIPERFFAPGRFDLCGHSHQWWHILVVVGIFAHYQGILAFYLWRMNTTCEEQAGFGW
jgi:adiponectin receptor